MVNTIKGKVLALHQELTNAEAFVELILKDLENCNKDTNLTEKIGEYARRMPDFKILAKQRIQVLSCIRQVCTGEMTIEKAIELFKTAQQQLDEALECFKL